MSENIIVLNSLGISFAKCKLEVHLSLLPLVYMIIVYFFQKNTKEHIEKAVAIMIDQKTRIIIEQLHNSGMFK